ncbi:MAG TPA: hypothetical protein VM600_03020 [Actinomycetota bacterium]|nr:hypothetical protein [Actinomycetota bacterium]
MKKALPVAVALALASSPAPVRASAQVVVSPPAATVTGFATPVVVAVKAAPLTSVNLDSSALHNVESIAKGPDDKPWCTWYLKGHCPLFWSPLIAAGETAPVHGLTGLAAGSSHAFKCLLHGNMIGTLVIV